MRGEHQVPVFSSIEVKRNIFDSRVQTLFVQTFVLFVGTGRQSIDTHTMVTSTIFCSSFLDITLNHPNAFQGQQVAFLVGRSTGEVWSRYRKFLFLIRWK